MHLHLTPEMQRLCSCATMAESKGSDPRSPRAPSPGGLTRTREKGDGVGGWCETCTKSGGTWLEGDKTGTDGIRLLCHQFFPSSFPPPASSTRSSKSFLQKMRKPKPLLFLRRSANQAQKIFLMVYLPISGRLCFSV